MILAGLALGILSAYLYKTIKKQKGIPESISQTSFILKDNVMFTCTMILIGCLMLPEMIEASSEKTQFLAFLSTLGICGVGASPLIKYSKNTIHYVCAYLCCISSLVMIALNNSAILLGWIPYIIYLLFSKRRTWAFWGELVCILNTLVYCIVH